jgi:hypothetical protein
MAASFVRDDPENWNTKPRWTGMFGTGAETFDRPRHLGGAAKFPAAGKKREKRSQ